MKIKRNYINKPFRYVWLMVALILLFSLVISIIPVQPAEAVTYYEVMFQANGGTYVGGGAEYQDIPAGGSVTNPPIYERTGYTFIGWDKEIDNITADCYRFAQWVKDTPTIYYTIIFDPAGGTITSGNGTQSIASGGSAVAPTVSRSGYTFSGWLGTYIGITSDRTITANWTQNTVNYYTVTFDPAGGTITSGSGTQSIASGGSAAAPIVSRSGYTFNGWTGIYTNVTSDRTITANWTKDTVYYTVTFDPAGGTITSGNGTQSIASGGNAVPPTVTRNGYTFNGWTGAYTSVTSNRTITANWKQDTVQYYEVMFQANGGTYVGGGAEYQDIQAGGSVTNPPIYERVGYIFSGWDQQISNITADCYRYAQWVKDTTTTYYTVTFDPAGGTITSGNDIQSIASGGSAVALIVSRSG